jgi:hypothetical protein
MPSEFVNACPNKKQRFSDPAFQHSPQTVINLTKSSTNNAAAVCSSSTFSLSDLDPDTEFDTAKLAERVESLRIMHKISREVLGRTILDISGVTLSYLLRSPDPWISLSEEKKTRYRKLYSWCCSLSQNPSHDLISSSGGGGGKPALPLPADTHAVIKNPRRGHRGDTELNTLEIGRDIRHLLSMYDIKFGFFANRRLFISKIYFSQLLSGQRGWDELSDDDKKLFRKIYMWTQATPDEFNHLKRQSEYEKRWHKSGAEKERDALFHLLNQQHQHQSESIDNNNNSESGGQVASSRSQF